MRRLTSLAAAVLAVLMLALPVWAQVDSEKDTIIRPSKRGSGNAQLIFVSAMDTINASGNDDTGGTYMVAGYTKTAPSIIYTVASGGTVAVDVVTYVAPTAGGPWAIAAHDTISATGTAKISISEIPTSTAPYVRLLLDGYGSNDAATVFTSLYVVFAKDPPG